MEDLGTYAIDNPPSAKSAHKIVIAQALAPETAMNSTVDVFTNLCQSEKNRTRTKNHFQLKRITKTRSFVT